MPSLGKVLIVEDDPGTADAFSLLLRLDGFEAESAGTGAAGIALALSGCFDVILVDRNLPDMSGVDVIRQLRAGGISSRMVVVTAFPDLDSSFDAASAGAVGYVDGPIFGDEVPAIVRHALYGPLPVRHPRRSGWTAASVHSASLDSHQVPVDPRVRLVLHRIHQEPQVPTHQLATDVGLSESRLRHLFKAGLGTSISRYRRRLTIQVVARLLTVTHDSLRGIADSVGIADFRSFRKEFRVRFGMSPQAYRTRFRRPEGRT